MLPTWLEWWLVLLLAAALGCDLVYTLQQPIWSPRDEIAHFDYVDKLTDGRLPRPDEPVSDDTFRMCTGTFTWARPQGFDGTRAGMGLAGTSYEAWQPPLYYLLLAPANLLLGACGVDDVVRITTLRILQFLFVCAAVVLVLALFRELRIAGVVGAAAGPLIALALALTNVVHYHSLGNDNLSPLLGVAFLYCHARHRRSGSHGTLWCAALVAGLAFWAKYSNGFLVLLHAIACCLPPDRSDGRRHRVRALATTCLPIAMVGALLLHNSLRFGDLLNTTITEQRFAPLVPTTDHLPLFLAFLVHDAFQVNLRPAPIAMASMPGSLGWCWWFLAVLGANAVLLGVQVWRRAWGRRQTFVGLAIATTAAVVATAYVLNLLRPVANWHAFRHYFAYSVLWWVALACPAVRLPPRIAHGAVLFAAALATAVCVRFAVTLV